MFGSVWKWAGQFRTSERNIGVTPWQIFSFLRNLLDDVQFHWGTNLLLATSIDRKIYIKALRNADKGDYHSLLQYVCGDVTT